MNKLIILAHPSEHGFVRKSALAYQQAAQAAGQQAVLIDLYSEPRQEFLNFQHVKELGVDEQRQAYQAAISQADELAFFFPLWWVDAPAILKNFIDNNFTSGFAYKYENGSPKGLLTGKTAKIFITCDGPRFFYRLTMTPFKMIWKNMIMRFCGIKTNHFFIFDQMRKRSPENKDALLKKIATLI